ncbi:DUF4124 domain-containing protein [Dokdonella fugitiva]|jgi:hypothetical protein|uniref:Uncharacterized protein DUF4124 n=1 Tax=Dokdonella fugitiva TaxID=328517 RepID=A0A4R2IFQ6_9GAMM|nr:DUF4124 domain-containing protein [Dokdonella fugitiva]MBA8882966.1 hypothetical protein [Dokdonella fugitiva]TCO43056.1 uncharacterized protein DUF4124 [Dokdonella fugitiva]
MHIPSSRLLVLALTACVGAGATGAVHATTPQDHNRYKWRDAQGNLHYSDSVPAEATKFGYDVVNPQGIVVKHVDRAKTADELAEAKLAASKALAERKAAEQRARDDEQLLSTYPQEEDLRRAQQQQLEMLNQQIKSSEVSLRNQEQSLAELLDRAAEAERTGKEFPPDQARQLAVMRKKVDAQKAAVAKQEADRDEASSHFEEEVAHYRELKARIAEARK